MTVGWLKRSYTYPAKCAALSCTIEIRNFLLLENATGHFCLLTTKGDRSITGKTVVIQKLFVIGNKKHV